VFDKNYLCLEELQLSKLPDNYYSHIPENKEATDAI
jgi:hypothetical protein